CRALPGGPSPRGGGGRSHHAQAPAGDRGGAEAEAGGGGDAEDSAGGVDAVPRLVGVSLATIRYPAVWTVIATVVIQQEQEAVRIPVWVSDLPSFRRWAKSDEFPQHGWYAYLNGELWVDPSMERLRHNRLKNKFAVVLTPLAERQPGLGLFLGDRMLL